MKKQIIKIFLKEEVIEEELDLFDISGKGWFYFRTKKDRVYWIPTKRVVKILIQDDEDSNEQQS